MCSRHVARTYAEVRKNREVVGSGISLRGKNLRESPGKRLRSIEGTTAPKRGTFELQLKAE